MYVVGVDLSGPANPENTAVSVFQDQGERLQYQALLPSATDAVLFEEKDPREAVSELMNREPSGEMDGLAGDLV